MKIIMLALLLSTALILCGWEISGYVQNRTGEGISEVLIKSSLGICLSGENGYYRLAAAAGDTLLFHKQDYIDRKITIEKIPVRVILERHSLQLPGREIRELGFDKVAGRRRLEVDSSLRTGDISAAEYLSGESGLLLEGSRSGGSEQSLIVPGFSGRHTLIMLDGIVLNQSGSSFDLSQLPMSVVKSIEIIPGTSEGGSGGMGTVINFITGSDQNDDMLTLEVSGGSFASIKGEVNWHKSYDKINFQLSGNYEQGENNYKYAVPQGWPEQGEELERKNNSHWQSDISGMVRYTTSLGRLSIKTYYRAFMRMLPGVITNPELFKQARMTGENLRLHAAWLKTWQKNQLELKSWYHQEETIYDNTRLDEPYSGWPMYYMYGINRQESRGIKPKYKCHMLEKVILDLGGELISETYEYKETTSPDNSIPRIKQQKEALFAEEKFETFAGDFSFWNKSALRSDWTENFGQEFSGSILTGIKTETSLKLQLWGGRLWGYTLPSFYSLYWKGDAQAIGNPYLSPERSDSWQLGGGLEFRGNHLDFSWRNDQIEDKIIWFQNFNHAWKPMNIGRAQVSNLLWSLHLEPVINWQIDASINFTKTADKTRLENGEPSAYYDKELIYTPDYTGKIGISWKTSALKLGLETELCGNQWTTRDQLSQEKELGAYELYHLFMGYEHNLGAWNVLWQVQLNNILDRDYSSYEYMPEPGRNLKISIKLRR